jgi:hypothetical protein
MNTEIEEIEVLISFIQGMEVNYKSRQDLKVLAALQEMKNELFKELEMKTDAEYLKNKWNVINNGDYTYADIQNKYVEV